MFACTSDSKLAVENGDAALLERIKAERSSGKPRVA